jgi:hypothetical protein
MSAENPTCTPAGQRTWSCRLDEDPQAVITARALAGTVLTGRDPALAEDAVLVTSELVTNALAHGAPPVTLAITVGTGPQPTLIIDVADASPDLPVQDLPGETGHFGLWIAGELARLTVHPTPTGKIVRATFGHDAPSCA